MASRHLPSRARRGADRDQFAASVAVHARAREQSGAAGGVGVHELAAQAGLGGRRSWPTTSRSSSASSMRRTARRRPGTRRTVRARYRAMWSVPGAPKADGTPSHCMTGGCNFYRATPLQAAGQGRAGAPATRRRRLDVRSRAGRVIWGETDRALTTGLVDGLELVCTDLELQRIPEGSHWVVHEQPDRVNALIRGFIAELICSVARTGRAGARSRQSPTWPLGGRPTSRRRAVAHARRPHPTARSDHASIDDNGRIGRRRRRSGVLGACSKPDHAEDRQLDVESVEHAAGPAARRVTPSSPASTTPQSSRRHQRIAIVAERVDEHR